MIFVHVRGLGFIKFLAIDGTSNGQIFFTQDFEQAARWESVWDANEELNGNIAARDMQFVKIEIVKP